MSNTQEQSAVYRQNTLWSKTLRVGPHIQDKRPTDKILLPSSVLDDILNLPPSAFQHPTADLSPNLLLPQPLLSRPTRRQNRRTSETESTQSDDSDSDSDSETDKLPPPRPVLPPPSSPSSTKLLPHLPSPLNFQLVNIKSQRTIHAGVREFTAEEGTIQLQPWMASSLGVERNDEEGGQGLDQIAVRLVILPKGTKAKFRPLNSDFRDSTITDYRSTFESALRHFSTLTKGEIISVSYGDSSYQFLVEDLQPADACSVTDTDLEVDILPVLGADDATTNANGLSGQISQEAELKNIVPGVEIRGKWSGTSEGAYFRVKGWSGQRALVKMTVDHGDADLFVSHDKRNPNPIDWTWACYGDQSEKILEIVPTDDQDDANDGDDNEAAENPYAECSELFVGIYGFSSNATEYRLLLTYETGLPGVESPTTANIGSVSQENQNAPGYVQCQNCRAWIPERTVQMHAAFCERNNVACVWGCGAVFKKSSQEEHDHWHCPSCPEIGNSGPKGLEKHQYYYHETHRCPDCQNPDDPKTFRSIATIAQHRRKECPERFHVCRYCHISVRAGPPSYAQHRHVIMKVSEHEVACGARTILCVKCNAPVRLTDVKTHARLHVVERQAQPLPFLVCRNRMCVRPATGSGSANALSLCPVCFGPFWISTVDPHQKKLMQRVAMAYHRQLTAGCGKSWCRNPYCATGSQHPSGTPDVGMPPFPSGPLDPTAAAATLVPLLKALNDRSVPFYLCTDESVSRKRTVVDTVRSFTAATDDATGRNVDAYQVEWIIKAIGALGDRAAGLDAEQVIHWLNENAPRMRNG